MQPLYIDENGTVRFKHNAIISYLFDSKKPLDLNEIACMPFSAQDREQLSQLLGYSVGGYADLSYVRRKQLQQVDAIANSLFLKHERKEKKK